MLHVGQQSAFPKISFIQNRMAKIENLIMQGLLRNAPSGRTGGGRGGRRLNHDDLSPLLSRRYEDTDGESSNKGTELDEATRLVSLPDKNEDLTTTTNTTGSPSSEHDPSYLNVPHANPLDSQHEHENQHRRRGSIIDEMRRQSAVFFDDSDVYGDESDENVPVTTEPNTGTVNGAGTEDNVPSPHES